MTHKSLLAACADTTRQTAQSPQRPTIPTLDAALSTLQQSSSKHPTTPRAGSKGQREPIASRQIRIYMALTWGFLFYQDSH